MTNFERIDDYLANRLTAQDKEAFEQQLAGDPALKEDFTFQQQIVKAVHHARATELKQMLNQVPVGGSGLSTGQLAATVISVGIVATGLYFFSADMQTPAPPPDKAIETVVQPESPQENPASTTPVQEAEPKEKTDKRIEPRKESSSKESKVATPVQKPALEVVDPSDEFKETQEPVDPEKTERTELVTSKLEVITNPSDKKYTFHYQFAEGKLMLYGPFDKSLYEILEIHSGSRSVFLFYRENYYLLDEKQNAIAPLQLIRDSKLLQKLKEYRGR